MPLTDIAIHRLVAKEKPDRVTDGKGLALLVHSNGSKYWQYRYRFNDKGKLLALGVYPEVTLAEARQKLFEARKQVASGVDPGAVRKLRKITKSGAPAESFRAGTVDRAAPHRSPRRTGHHQTRPPDRQPGLPLRHRYRCDRT